LKGILQIKTISLVIGRSNEYTHSGEDRTTIFPPRQSKHHRTITLRSRNVKPGDRASRRNYRYREYTFKGLTGTTMLTDTDRRIEQIYQTGLMRIKTLYHFHRPKCEQPGCTRKLSTKDDKHGHTLCGICYTAELKTKRLAKAFNNPVPPVKSPPLLPVSEIRPLNE
jgi:hypothetical protein